MTSSSSVPKSTSSMTLPLSTPSSHSQFEEPQGQSIRVTEFNTHPLAGPQGEVEKRIDLLGRYGNNMALKFQIILPDKW